MIEELCAAVIGFFQLELLNHRTHRAVEVDDALAQKLSEFFAGFGQR